MRDNWQAFLDYLKENKDWIEPIIYTSGLQPYNAYLMKLLDPNQEVFDKFLYQNACYLFEIKEEDVIHLVKDISRFRNRDIRRCVLLDSKPTNYMMTPENAIPIVPYTAEYVEDEERKSRGDNFLVTLTEELEEIKDLEDIRPTLQQKYKVRQLLKNSKLI